MSLPPLRQPHLIKKSAHTINKLTRSGKEQDVNIIPQYVIVTLNNNQKLVVSSDFYHGIIRHSDSTKCVFCNIDMDLKGTNLEMHKISVTHCNRAKKFPHILEYGENLIRQINPKEYYCTLCNVLIPNYMVTRHVVNDGHQEELGKAVVKASIYKAVDSVNH